ncbi:hypothetical protein OROGR_024041 [Orobanche gracilis]
MNDITLVDIKKVVEGESNLMDLGRRYQAEMCAG